MLGLVLETARCCDGVDLHHLEERIPPPNHTLAAGGIFSAHDVFRYRTDRCEPLRLEIKSLENPLVVAFMNARDDHGRAEFLSKYGMLFPENEILHSEVLRSQDSFAGLLARIHHRKPAVAVATVNQAMAAHPSFNLKPTLQIVGKAPQLMLGCATLVFFMLMEVAMIATYGVHAAHCQHCHTMFVTGTLTGRRSSAKFCGDRCRMAAMRARRRP
jgi:hypothetical protein